MLEPGATTMYLGRSLSLTDVHDSELRHRIAKAWAKFGTYRQELTDKTIPLILRLKLFQSVVTPTVLYGSCSWVMTQTREQALKTTQLKMVRAILGMRRLVTHGSDASEHANLETWVEWVRRATAEARKMMEAHRVSDWVTEQTHRVKRWGEKIGKMESHRWTKRMLAWSPFGRRSRGHPCCRWAEKMEVSLLSPAWDA